MSQDNEYLMFSGYFPDGQMYTHTWGITDDCTYEQAKAQLIAVLEKNKAQHATT